MGSIYTGDGIHELREKRVVRFYEVRNMIVSEKLHCKIPQVEELRFSDSPVLLVVTLITSSPRVSRQGCTWHTSVLVRG